MVKERENMKNRNFKIQLEREIKELEELREQLVARLARTPEGTLHVHQTGSGKPQYYHYIDSQRVYLQAGCKETAIALAQKTYDGKALTMVEERLKAAKRLWKEYEVSIGDLYEMQTDARKELVQPLVMPDEMYIKRWYESYQGSVNPYQNTLAIYTEKGEAVRSKSEKILADLFYRNNIPYIYEPRLELGKGKAVYPDFLILHVKQRKTYIFEHFGMMDNPDYSKSALEKLSLYEENGYWYGETLLYTFETGTSPLNTKLVERMLRHFL